ncbi:MAG: hypothetical protein ACI4UE_04585 [Candidatus Scatovivens sp.]
MNIEEKIKSMYKNRKWNEQITDIIIEFLINFEKTFGSKYINRIIKRLEELEEIKEEYNDSKYIASSKRNYIIFFKKVEDNNELKYVLEHELFHFIQKEDSNFEKIPKEYEDILSNQIKIELLEEVFVQYFTAKINNKTPEYKMKNKDGKVRKYWLNECYKNIVWLGEELENRIGINAMINMYMEDSLYEKERKKFDNKYGKNAFAIYLQTLTKYA